MLVQEYLKELKMKYKNIQDVNIKPKNHMMY